MDITHEFDVSDSDIATNSKARPIKQLQSSAVPRVPNVSLPHSLVSIAKRKDHTRLDQKGRLDELPPTPPGGESCLWLTLARWALPHRGPSPPRSGQARGRFNPISPSPPGILPAWSGCTSQKLGDLLPSVVQSSTLIESFPCRSDNKSCLEFWHIWGRPSTTLTSYVHVLAFCKTDMEGRNREP